MNNAFVFLVVGLIVGVAGGYLASTALTSPSTQSHDEHSVGEMHGDGEHHAGHALTEVDPTLPIPTVSLRAVEDSIDGYNLNIAATNFTFSPERVGGAPLPNEGHAHLFINGKKVARVYGAWMSIPSSLLVEGENVIEVTLHANDHSEWTVLGKHIAATVTVTK